MATGEKSPPVYRTEEFAQSALSLPLRSNCLGFFQDLHPDTFRQFSLCPSNNSGETSSKKDPTSQEPHLCSAAG